MSFTVQLNLEYLTTMAGPDPDQQQTLMQLAQHQLRMELDQLQIAFVQQQATVAADTCHQLLTTAPYLGCPSFTHQIKALQVHLKSPAPFSSHARTCCLHLLNMGQALLHQLHQAASK